jgi:hypothetical protein
MSATIVDRESELGLLSRSPKLIVTLCLAFIANAAIANANEYTIDWARQIGTAEDDHHQSLALDAFGNIYVSGYSSGSLVHETNGKYEVFLAKYDTSGSLQWARPAMTGLHTRDLDLSIDESGNIFAVGATASPLISPTDPPSEVQVARYDATGAMQWVQTLGLRSSGGSGNVSTDPSGNIFVAGNYFIAGETYADEFAASVSRLDNAGNVLWSRKAPGEVGSVVADGLGNVYVSGTTGYRFGGPNSLLTKFDAEGELLWTREWGTEKVDSCCGLATDEFGNVYVAGYSGIGILGPQPADATNDIFLSKISPSGDTLWTQSLASDASDVGGSIVVHGDRVYVSGSTIGSLGGEPLGSFDAFVAAFDINGAHQWTHQFGTETWDFAADIAADANGNLHLAGATQGSFAAPKLGDQYNFDALIIRMTPIPEPSSSALLLGSLVCGIVYRRHRRRKTRRRDS